MNQRRNSVEAQLKELRSIAEKLGMLEAIKIIDANIPGADKELDTFVETIHSGIHDGALFAAIPYDE